MASWLPTSCNMKLLNTRNIFLLCVFIALAGFAFIFHFLGQHQITTTISVRTSEKVLLNYLAKNNMMEPRTIRIGNHVWKVRDYSFYFPTEGRSPVVFLPIEYRGFGKRGLPHPGKYTEEQWRQDVESGMQEFLGTLEDVHIYEPYENSSFLKPVNP